MVPRKVVETPKPPQVLAFGPFQADLLARPRAHFAGRGGARVLVVPAARAHVAAVAQTARLVHAAAGAHTWVGYSRTRRSWATRGVHPRHS